MEGRTLDPYEEQLLNVFKSCDDSQLGSLDRKGLEALCDKLQLEDQGLELIECLLSETGVVKRVTYSEFRDGLLTLLGESQKSRDYSGDSSPVREVSPKFVFGEKKYGRRSRPENKDFDESDISDTEIVITVDGDQNEIIMRSAAPALHDDDTQLTKRWKNKQNFCEIDSIVTAAESIKGANDLRSLGEDNSTHNSLDINAGECLRAACERLGVGADGFLDRAELSLVCKCIGMEGLAEEVVQQLFDKLSTDQNGRISLENFLIIFRNAEAVRKKPEDIKPTFQRSEEHAVLHSNQSTNSLSLDSSGSGLVNSEAILELWEMSGIRSPSSLLHNLGYADKQFTVSELMAILELEIQNMETEKRSQQETSDISTLETLLQASLALCQAEVRCLKLTLEHMSGERDKLRADLDDANDRASLLAQEVDEHHARLEESSQLQIRLMEQKHSEQLRELTEQLGSEREQLVTQISSLEKQLNSMQEDDSRARSQLVAVQKETEALYKENQHLTEQLIKAKQEKEQLCLDLENLSDLQQRLQELEGNQEQEQVLLRKISDLQAEITVLRDRNDELTMELETLSTKSSLKLKKSLVNENCDSLEESATINSMKRRGDSPLTLPLEESSEDESPRLGKMRRCEAESVDIVNIGGLQIQTEKSSNVDSDLNQTDLVPVEMKFEEPGNTYLSCEESISREDENLDHSMNLDVVKIDQSTQNVNMPAFHLNFKRLLQEIFDDNNLMSNLCNKCKNLVRETFLQVPIPEIAMSESEKLKDSTLNAKEIQQLDEVKFQIIKILRENEACSKENCALKMHISDLKNKLMDSVYYEQFGKSAQNGCGVYFISNLDIESKNFVGCGDTVYPPIPKDNYDSLSNGDSEMLIDNNNSEKVVCTGSEKSVPENSVFIINKSSDQQICDITNGASSYSNKLCDYQAEENEKKLDSSDEKCVIEELRKQVDNLTLQLSASESQRSSERKELLTRCSELENSLELLHLEYEKCEDYWAGKLDEERQIYDQELRTSNEKFSELLVKVQEYEEAYGNSGRLPPIEERISLEKQVLEMEEEYAYLKKKIEKEQALKNEEISQLLERITFLESIRNNKGEKSDAAVQISEVIFDSEEKEINETNCNDDKNQPDTKFVKNSEKYTEMNRVQIMEAELYELKQELHRLRFILQHQFHEYESKLHSIKRDHEEEMHKLYNRLQETQNNLLHQTSINKKQIDSLARSDILVKELFVENAQLREELQVLQSSKSVRLTVTSDSTSL